MLWWAMPTLRKNYGDRCCGGQCPPYERTTAIDAVVGSAHPTKKTTGIDAVVGNAHPTKKLYQLILNTPIHF